MDIWPWVSRRAFRLLLDERDRLRSQNDELVEQLTRLARVTNGLTELPARAHEPDPMPEEVRRIANRFQNPMIRQRVLALARELRRDGLEWDEVPSVIESRIQPVE